MLISTAAAAFPGIRRWVQTGGTPVLRQLGAAAVELTPDDLELIDSALSGIEVRGAGHHEEMEARWQK